MKKSTLSVKSLGTILISMILVSCSSSKDTPPSAAEAPLAGSMQSMKATLVNLLPLVLDPAKFNLPANKERIQKDVKDLVDVSKQVNHSPVMNHTDPSMRFISTAFSQDLARAQESLELDKREFARYTLLNVSSYCIECHTRTSSGPAFTTPELEKTISTMDPMARGEFLLATRQFVKAFAEFENVIRTTIASGTRFFDLDKAVRYALAISVKFQQDPKKSLEIVQLIESSDKAPYYLKQDAHAWAGSIREWQAEKKTKASSDILRHSDNLLKLGKTAQMGASNRGGEIYFLRAISELNGFLQAPDVSPDNMGHGLYLMGIAYEAVGDVSIWSLHEDYFESCIRLVAHSKWAERCYTKLEESSYMGYTGTSGVQLPIDVQMKLESLRKLAFPL